MWTGGPQHAASSPAARVILLGYAFFILLVTSACAPPTGVGVFGYQGFAFEPKRFLQAHLHHCLVLPTKIKRIYDHIGSSKGSERRHYDATATTRQRLPSAKTKLRLLLYSSGPLYDTGPCLT
eukprot:8166264-Pyramimonas_sp.AAC.2